MHQNKANDAHISYIWIGSNISSKNVLENEKEQNCNFISETYFQSKKRDHILKYKKKLIEIDVQIDKNPF